MIVFLFYHKVDLDGFISGYILKKHFIEKNNNQVIVKNGPFDENDLNDDNHIVMYSRPYNYNDEINLDEIKEAIDKNKIVKVYFVDCCPHQKNGYFEKLYDLLGKNLYIIDHHITAIKYIENFEKENNGRTPVSGLRSIDYSGCELTYMYVNVTDYDDIASAYIQVPTFVKYLGRYDIYDTSSTNFSWEKEILVFQYGFRIAVPDLTDIVVDNPTIDLLLGNYVYNMNLLMVSIKNNGKAILEYNKNKNLKILKGYGHKTPVHFITETEELTFDNTYWVTDYLNNSMVFGEKYNDPEMVYLVIQHDIFDDNYTVSLYSTSESEIDVSGIAGKMGGGGHKHASGFKASDILFLKGINELRIYKSKHPSHWAS
jgi:oligoribonuclease NrnB/cAMP/cGMP phosphodiesterase (DHH superfamily)